VDLDDEAPRTPSRIDQVEAAQLLETTRLSVADAGKAMARLNKEVLAAMGNLGPALSAFTERLTSHRSPEQALANVRPAPS
jgi:hypothetical protein